MILRIVGGFLALVIVTTIGLVIAYFVWLADYKRELTNGSQIASTPLGEIEYAIAGEGTQLLRIHGSPGGYDHSIAAPRARPELFAGLKVIALSRPGYLRTPLATARTAAEQADLYAALLDQLGIKRAIVYGVSGGGPSALQFAVRHPDRTLGLILVVPYLVTDPEYDRKPSGSALGMFAQTGQIRSRKSDAPTLPSPVERGRERKVACSISGPLPCISGGGLGWGHPSDANYDLAVKNELALFAQDSSFWLGMQMFNERVASMMMPKMMPGFDAHAPGRPTRRELLQVIRDQAACRAG